MTTKKIEKKITSAKVKDKNALSTPETFPILRPETLVSKTFKINYQEKVYYVTIGYLDTKPLELFIQSKNAAEFEFLTLTALLITATLRSTKDISFLLKELSSIPSPLGGGYSKVLGKTSFYPSFSSILSKLLAEPVKLLSQPSEV